MLYSLEYISICGSQFKKHKSKAEVFRWEQQEWWESQSWRNWKSSLKVGVLFSNFWRTAYKSMTHLTLCGFSRQKWDSRWKGILLNKMKNISGCQLCVEMERLFWRHWGPCPWRELNRAWTTIWLDFITAVCHTWILHKLSQVLRTTLKIIYLYLHYVRKGT